MTLTLPTPESRRTGSWPLRWLAVLSTGLLLFVAVLTVLMNTGDPIYIPSLLFLGASVVPATVTTLVAELDGTRRLSFARLALAAVLGGVVGGVLAGQLESDTARAVGSLPYLMVGLIEESAKLAIAVTLLARRRPRPSALEGLVFGIAVGSGFAAMETMGYAFVTLVDNSGNLQSVDSVLLVRALGSLGGHAVWTGLACAAWYSVRSARHRWLARMRFVATFAGVVCLHTLWDASAGGLGYLAVGATGVLVLGVTIWRCRRNARQGSASVGPQPRRELPASTDPLRLPGV
ncbi:MAG: PrsW family intramembrane metalloprotease [Actinomycetota bacterium]|nr:PrsW family intramembrane metalloprotease [Actinomycetota bacterium]